MRIALFGDIHSNYHALDAVLADMAARGVDRLVCLGDITLKGPLPKECVDRVRDLGCPVVLGNAESAYQPAFHPARFPPRNQSQVVLQADFERHVAALNEADRYWLTGFPLLHTELVDGVRIDLFHATPADNYVLVMPWVENDRLAEMRVAPDTAAIGFGHCHRAFVRTVGGMLVANAGSVGVPFDGDPRPAYAVLSVDSGRLSAEIIRVPYDAEAAIRTAKSLQMAGWELFAHTARTGQFPG